MRSPCGPGAKLGSEPKQAGLGLGLTCSPQEVQGTRSLPRSWARAHSLVQTAACLGKWPQDFRGLWGGPLALTLDKVATGMGWGPWPPPSSGLCQHSAEAQSQGLGGRPPPNTCRLVCDGHTEPLPRPRARVPSASPPGTCRVLGGPEHGGRAHRVQAENLPGHRGPSLGPLWTGESRSELPKTGTLSLGPGRGLWPGALTLHLQCPELALSP